MKPSPPGCPRACGGRSAGSRCRCRYGWPTLLIVGGRDRFYDRALFTETARLIPGCRLEILPERGHVGVLSDPRFPGLVLDFMDGL